MMKTNFVFFLFFISLSYLGKITGLDSDEFTIERYVHVARETYDDVMVEDLTTEVDADTTIVWTTTTELITATQHPLPGLENTRVAINGSLTMDLTYEAELADPTTDAYKTLEMEVVTAISATLSGQDGFQEVKIIEFTQGSVIAVYTVSYSGAEVWAANSTQFCSNLDESLATVVVGSYDTLSSAIDNCVETVTNTFAVICDDQASVLCNTAVQDCVPCTDTVCALPATCPHKCVGYLTTSDCIDDGEVCTLDDANQPICTCAENYLHVSAESCLHQNVIIILASMVGGFLIIMFILLLAISVHIGRKGKRADDEDYSSSDQSSMFHRPSELWMTPKDDEVLGHSRGKDKSGLDKHGLDNGGFEPDDGISGENSRYVSNQLSPRGEHDPAYEELAMSDIYRNFKADLSKIDTETKYRISRPQANIENQYMYGNYSVGSGKSDGKEMTI